MGEKIMRRGYTGKRPEMRRPEELPELTGNVSFVLANLRARNETERRPADIYDLANLFSAERDDLKINATTRRQIVTSWDAKLNAVRRLQAKEAIDEKTTAEIASYLSEHIASSDAKANNEALGESARTKAASNGKVYVQLRNAFCTAIDPQRTTEGADKPMTEKDSETLMKDLLLSAEEFSQYAITLEQTNTVLDTMGRPEKFTFDQMTQFLNALTTDVESEQERYEKNPKWKIKKEIVLRAQSFYQEHENDKEKGLIYVTAATNGSIRHVGWHASADNEIDTQDYIFDPEGEIDDKKSLSYHQYNLDQFPKLLRDAIPGAQRATENYRKGKKVNPQDTDYLRKLLVLFAGSKVGEEMEKSSEGKKDN